MYTASLDTLSLVEMLTAGNDFTIAQAKKVAKAFKDFREQDLNIIATKQDLREYFLKTIITLGTIVSVVGGVIISVLKS